MSEEIPGSFAFRGYVKGFRKLGLGGIRWTIDTFDTTEESIVSLKGAALAGSSTAVQIAIVPLPEEP